LKVLIHLLFHSNLVNVAQVVCLWLMCLTIPLLYYGDIHIYIYIYTMALTYIKPDKLTYLVLKDLAKMNGIDAHCIVQYTSIPFIFTHYHPNTAQ
jgi:hypothetical protein